MAIITDRVLEPLKYGVYQASDHDLRINGQSTDKQHNVVVLSIDKDKNTAVVKTITSLEKLTSRNNSYRYIFKNRKLGKVKNGRILPIPKNQMNSKLYSGIVQRKITIGLDKLYYKNDDDRTRFPNSYRDLIK